MRRKGQPLQLRPVQDGGRVVAEHVGRIVPYLANRVRAAQDVPSLRPDERGGCIGVNITDAPTAV